MEISIADGNKWIVSYGVIIGFPNFDAKDSNDVFVALMDLRCERMKEIRASQDPALVSVCLDHNWTRDAKYHLLKKGILSMIYNFGSSQNMAPKWNTIHRSSN